MSDWIRLAFVSHSWPEPTPILALNYFGNELEGILCDSIPNMTTENPGMALAAFTAECSRMIRDPRCVELSNLDLKCEEACQQQNWPADHPIWQWVDYLVDIDRWHLIDSKGSHPILGANLQSKFDSNRFDRWPRRAAWLAGLFLRKPPDVSKKV